MAKQKKTDDAELLAAFEELDKLNPYATLLSKNTLSIVDDWYDTGSMSLNAICSGSLYKGIPKGRVAGFAGPSQSGKTYLMNKIIANAQKKGCFGVIFDSEMAVDASSGAGLGLDPERVKHVPVSTIEDTRNQICVFLDKAIEKKLFGKFIIAIDSLGNLGSAKEDADVGKDKSAADMGTRAKAIKSLFRQITYRAAKAGVTVLFSNHIYDDPVAMFKTLIKTQSGGKGPEYMSSLLVQLGKKPIEKDEKNDEDIALPEMKKYSGTILRMLTTKNRFVPPFLEAEMYLNFVTGPSKYHGLVEMAVQHGALIQNGSTYCTVNEKGKEDEKLGYYKNWKDNTVLWEKNILPKLEASINTKYRYGGESQPEAPEPEVLEAEAE